MLLSSAPVKSLTVPEKRGRPKKSPEVKTTLTFKPESMADVDSERIQAQAGAYWQENRWKPSQVAKKDDNASPGPGLTASLANSQPVSFSLPAATATGRKPVQPKKRLCKSGKKQAGKPDV
ncbi:hypothetical protein PtA15_3A416 [Puccinia triticina]|uniref:Uncharacterized protein n=1 Tax=Puccinia triticina TaxID=208348 RepID=A0ABY7CD62_9BASI|nr:uncharacterized protein PtA15_3A416 [Puccinia triticina]WAQ83050.1 hypothetical protein PtA15_3A416 [Puccinia triticina]